MRSNMLNILLFSMICHGVVVLWLCLPLTVNGKFSRIFMAKENNKTGQDEPYNILENTLGFCESFEKCSLDAICSSFSMDEGNKTTRLYSLSMKPSGDFVLLNSKLPAKEGYIYCRRLNYTMHVDEDKKKNWLDARADCQKANGDLMILDTDEKYTEVKELLGTIQSSLWLGGMLVNSTFRWINGEEVLSPFWHPGEPDDPENQDKMTTGYDWFKSFALANDDGDQYFKYICEY